MHSIFSFVLGKDKVCYICIVADRRLAFIGVKIRKKKTILPVQIDIDVHGVMLWLLLDEQPSQILV